MNENISLAQISQLKSTIRFQRGTLLFGGLILLVSMILMIRISGNEKTIVVPPNIKTSYWVNSTHISAPGLEQMGEYLAHYILNVTPDNLEHNQSVVMQLTGSESNSEIKTRMEAAARRLKRDNVSTVFWPGTITSNEAKQAVAVEGHLWTMVNGAKVSDRPTAYMMTFVTRAGRTYLATFKEVPSDGDPFHLNPASSIATKVDEEVKQE